MKRVCMENFAKKKPASTGQFNKKAFLITGEQAQ